MKPKIREKWRKDATIKIETLLEVTENPKGSFKNDEKLINININKGYMTSSCSFTHNKKGKKLALKFIKEELYF